MKCVLFVCACRLECNQQLSAAYCSQSASCGHFGNEEYIESYGKTYDGYIYIYIYIQTRLLYYSYMWGSLRLAPSSIV